MGIRRGKMGRAVTTASVAGVAVLAIAGTALADFQPVTITQRSGQTADGQGRADATCAGGPGVTTAPDAPTKFEVTTTVSSKSSATGVVPLATGAVCIIKDRTLGWEYGRVPAALVGPTAVGVGTVNVPAGHLISYCISISATFSDGTGILDNPC